VAMAKAPAKKAKKKVTIKKATNKKVAKKAPVKKVVKKKVATKKVVAKRAPKKTASKKVVKKASIKKIVVKKVMKKVSTKKATTKQDKKKAPKLPIKKTVTIDYFKLPFEVHYSDCISVTQYEFKSDKKTDRFADVKAVHMDQGRSWGTEFSCDKNNGPELYCCLTNSHDEVAPNWLSFQEESDIRFNHGCNYAVQIEGDEIKFVELTDEQEDEGSDEYLNIDDMDYYCSYAFMAYEIGESCPDYIILDAEDSRIKIDLDGYELDDEDKRIESRRIINIDELDYDKYCDYESSELWDAKYEWVKLTLETDFPKDKNLSLAFRTQ
jgi:hypothetical protein